MQWLHQVVHLMGLEPMLANLYPSIYKSRLQALPFVAVKTRFGCVRLRVLLYITYADCVQCGGLLLLGPHLAKLEHEKQR